MREQTRKMCVKSLNHKVGVKRNLTFSQLFFYQNDFLKFWISFHILQRNKSVRSGEGIFVRVLFPGVTMNATFFCDHIVCFQCVFGLDIFALPSKRYGYDVR